MEKLGYCYSLSSITLRDPGFNPGQGGICSGTLKLFKQHIAVRTLPVYQQTSRAPRSAAG